MIVERIMVKKVNELTDKVAETQIALEVAQEEGVVTDIAKAEIRLEDAAKALEEYLKKLEKVERTLATVVTVGAVVGSTAVAVAKTQTAKNLNYRLTSAIRDKEYLEEAYKELDIEYDNYREVTDLERKQYEEGEEA